MVLVPFKHAYFAEVYVLLLRRNDIDGPMVGNGGPKECLIH